MLSRVAESIYWMSRYVERAENVARFVEVNLQLMLDAPTGCDQQWEPLVATTGDHEDFTKRYGTSTQENVDREFPRAVQFCLLSARDSLHAISGTPVGTFHHRPEKLLGRLCSDLSYASVDEIISSGLHEYLDELQTKVNQAGRGIHETFFAFKMPKQSIKSVLGQAQ